MKSTMPYIGISMPTLRAECRPLFDRHPLPTFDAWRDAVLTIWRGATFREERYVAIALTGHRAYDDYQRMIALPLYRELIVTGAWWDYVDPIATNRLGTLLRRCPTPMTKAMRTWARSKDIWLRRSAILCQARFKKDTDLALLYDCIEPSIESKEFFLRKAIGWALREYAKADPSEVRRYVTANETRLSGLSKREALKHHS
jgi:3-methyladenine DNA glycosylase AlkD